MSVAARAARRAHCASRVVLGSLARSPSATRHDPTPAPRPRVAARAAHRYLANRAKQLCQCSCGSGVWRALITDEGALCLRAAGGEAAPVAKPAAEEKKAMHEAKVRVRREHAPPRPRGPPSPACLRSRVPTAPSLLASRPRPSYGPLLHTPCARPTHTPHTCTVPRGSAPAPSPSPTRHQLRAKAERERKQKEEEREAKRQAAWQREEEKAEKAKRAASTTSGWCTAHSSTHVDIAAPLVAPGPS